MASLVIGAELSQARPSNGHDTSFGNTKQRLRRIMSQSCVPGFGRKTDGTVAVSKEPS